MYALAIIHDTATASSPTVTHAGQVWFDTQGFSQDPIYLNLDTEENQQAVQEFRELANVDRLPTVLFMKNTGAGQVILTRIEGASTYQQVLNTAERVLAGEYDNAQGEGGHLPAGQNFLGLGLFNLNFPIPAWLWLIAGGLAGIQAANAKKTGWQLFWGSLAAISLGNYSNAQKR